MTWLLATGSDGIEGRWLSVDRPINTASTTIARAGRYLYVWAGTCMEERL